jgi:hypothetical protein
MYKIIGADGKEYGPISADQLRQWVSEGRANAQTRVLAEGAADWRPLVEFPEYAALLAGAPAAAPAPIRVAPVPRTNPMAVTGMIMGIISVVACCCYGFPFNLLGIIFSLIGLSQIKSDPQNQQGRGMAIAGLVLSILSILLAVGLLAFGIAVNAPELLRKLRET